MAQTLTDREYHNIREYLQTLFQRRSPRNSAATLAVDMYVIYFVFLTYLINGSVALSETQRPPRFSVFRPNCAILYTVWC
jgi:hypothetical protein